MWSTNECVTLGQSHTMPKKPQTVRTFRLEDFASYGFDIVTSSKVKKAKKEEQKCLHLRRHFVQLLIKKGNCPDCPHLLGKNCDNNEIVAQQQNSKLTRHITVFENKK